MNQLITENSILNKIPINVDKKQVFFIEGIRYCANSISMRYENMRVEIEKLSLLENKESLQEESCYKAFYNAWNMIDWTYRLTVLLGSLSKENSKGPKGENFTFLQKTKGFRNTLHHLDERIDEKILSLNAPVWGTITWVQFLNENLGRSFVLVAGHMREEFLFRFNNPLAFTYASVIDHIKLDAVIKGAEKKPTSFHIESIDLSELFQRTQTIIKKLETEINKQVEPHLQNGILNRFYILSIDFQPDLGEKPA
jgi:hypothetical protein